MQLGPYNPDWAVLVDKDGTERLVVETKRSRFSDDLRDKESAKIKCGQAHFAELANHTLFLRAADAIHFACAREHGFKIIYSNDKKPSRRRQALRAAWKICHRMNPSQP